MSTPNKKELTQIQREVLLSDLKARQSRNQRFSQRAYAQTLGVSPALLSQVLTGKAALGVAAAAQVAAALGLVGDQRERFVPEHEPRKHWQPARRPKFLRLTDEQFHLMSSWKARAVYSAVGLRRLRGDPQTIAKALGLRIPQTQSILRTLVRIGLIEASGDAFELKVTHVRSHNGPTTKEASIRLLREILRGVDRYLQSSVGEDAPAACATIRCRRQDLPKVKAELYRSAERLARRFGDERFNHDTVIQIILGYAELTDDAS